MRVDAALLCRAVEDTPEGLDIFGAAPIRLIRRDSLPAVLETVVVAFISGTGLDLERGQSLDVVILDPGLREIATCPTAIGPLTPTSRGEEQFLMWHWQISFTATTAGRHAIDLRHAGETRATLWLDVG